MTVASTPATTEHDHGEQLDVSERVIVSPAVGIFRPAADVTSTVAEGQTIGVLETVGESHPVRSPFSGALMGMLATAGERVRAGQPIAWLQTLGAAPA